VRVALLQLPWLSIALILPLLGALIVSRTKELRDSAERCLLFLAASLLCNLIVLAGYDYGSQEAISAGKTFRVDSLSVPLLLVNTITHLLVGVGTVRKAEERFTFTALLLSQAIVMAMITCQNLWLLIALLSLEALLPVFAMRRLGNRHRPYFLYMALFIGLLVLGGAFLPNKETWPVALCLAALLLRNGVFPLHSWLAELFEKATPGIALPLALSFGGVLGTIRLVLPYAPETVLGIAQGVTLLTAVYGGAMALTMREPRRFFSYLCMSQSAMVLCGVLQHSSIGLTAALCLWISTALSLAGLGFVLRVVEARFGNLSLGVHHGLYGHAPALALCFLFTGLSSINFPGTIGFMPLELLISGTMQKSFGMGAALALASMLNCIAILRVYFQIFTGRRRIPFVTLPVTQKERVAIVLLALIVFGGGVFPQPGIHSRHLAAEALLSQRDASFLP
jgi:NADH-quinone oxidoreductase subunit M